MHLVEAQPESRPRGRPRKPPVDGLKDAEAKLEANALTYTLPAASRATGISESGLRRAEKAGLLRFVRVCGRTLVDGDSLRALIRGDAARKDAA